MATFTITTPVNIDSLVGKTGGDIYNINGGYLTIDQDSRNGLNQSTSSTLGTITLSATLGGSCEINSTKVRLIPYNLGTGNVPNYNTLINKEGASGLLLGVYSALNVAPTAPGVVMPTSGFIKIKQWNSISFTSGNLNNIGATATGADTAGWLQISGDETGLCTINRLNLFKVQGDYFYLGTTGGNRNNVYQIPSNGENQYHAGVEVETDVPGTYEFYSCAGTLTALASTIATDVLRGKVCWIDIAGVLRFGNDGTNSTGGYLPPSGRKIRIGNIFLSNNTIAIRTNNALPNIVLATRYEFSTLGGGALIINKASVAWYLNLNQPYSVSLNDIGVCTNITISEVAEPINWINVNVGQEATNSQTALLISLCFSGGNLTNCKFFRSSLVTSGFYVASCNDIVNFNFINCLFLSGTKAANAATGSISLNRASSCNFSNITLGGGRIVIVNSTKLNILNTTYYDHPAVNTTVSIPMYCFDISLSSSIIKIEGLSFGGLFMTQPYNGILSIAAAGCTDITMRNIGTYENPLSLGSPRKDDVPWTRATTTATVTSVGHPFMVGDNVYIVVSSDITAIIVGLKTITAVTETTFSFACLNVGTTSGTVCYFGAKSGNLFVLGTSSAANRIKIQRIFTPHTRVNLYTTDNTAKNITMENVFSDYLNAPLVAMLNGFSKGVSGTPPLTAQTAVYGTHWFNGYVCDVADNKNSQTYNRTTTTVTITSINHSLRTGMLISVDPIAAPTTFTASFYSVTVIDSANFRITVANAGATSGVIDYNVANGRIGLLMNEATSDTLDRYEINSGNPSFTSTGGLFMPNVGDQITFLTPNYLIGQGSTFPIFEPIIGTSLLTRYKIEYALDINNGNGFGSFHNLYFEKTGAVGTSGGNTFSLTDVIGVEVGDYVWGTGISPRAKVINISSNIITIDRNNIAAVSGIIRFNHLPSETNLDPSLGIKMKWRFTTVVVNIVPITFLYIQTESTVLGRSNQYPLDSVTIKIQVRDINTNLPIENARVYLKTDPQGLNIFNELTDSNGVVETDFNFEETISVVGRVRKATEAPYYKTSPIVDIINEDGLSSTIFLISDD